jgi:hypothetical protein
MGPGFALGSAGIRCYPVAKVPDEPQPPANQSDEDEDPLVDKLARRALGPRGRIPRYFVVSASPPPSRRARSFVIGAAVVAFVVFVGTTFSRQLDEARLESACERGKPDACAELCTERTMESACRELERLCERGNRTACSFKPDHGSSR